MRVHLCLQRLHLQLSQLIINIGLFLNLPDPVAEHDRHQCNNDAGCDHIKPPGLPDRRPVPKTNTSGSLHAVPFPLARTLKTYFPGDRLTSEMNLFEEGALHDLSNGIS